MANINKLLYPVFILRLSFLLFIFLVKVFLVLYPKIILLFLALFIAIINSWLFIKNYFSQERNLGAEKIVSASKDNLENIKKELNLVNKKQGSHQGILLNLNLVEEKLSNSDSAKDYWQRAINQNPNSNYFK